MDSLPASVLTPERRKGERLQRAARHLWHRDDGVHRREITKLLRLVDAGAVTTDDALAQLGAATAASQRAAAAQSPSRQPATGR